MNKEVKELNNIIKGLDKISMEVQDLMIELQDNIDNAKAEEQDTVLNEIYDNLTEMICKLKMVK